MIKEEYDILERCYEDCIDYWERKLGVSKNESKEPLKHAIEDIEMLTTNPYVAFNSPMLDVETKEIFINNHKIYMIDDKEKTEQKTILTFDW